MPKRSLGPNLALAVVAVLVSLLAVEGVCQGLARLWIFPTWDRDMERPNFFLARSDDPVLAYELRPDYSIETNGQVLHINHDGLRADSDDRFTHRRRIALLGDSVTMGAGVSQERTISALLEGRLGAAGSDAVVLNYGVPGYATRELRQFLLRKNGIYHANQVVYLLNLNDFALRDSVYEGADNGLYRMFVRPRWETRWFVRKAIYRLMKHGPVSVGWYHWMFRANEGSAEEDIRQMAAICARDGAAFAVVLLPSGAGYGPDGYALADIYERLTDFLRTEGIPSLAPITEFGADPERYLDETDHLRDPGNELMAEQLLGFLTEIGSVGAGRSR